MNGTILLTSNGLGSNSTFFEKAVEGMNTQLLRVCILSDALECTDVTTRDKYLQESINELVENGINHNNISIRTITHESISEMRIYDILYVLGGNTFILMDHMIRYGFGKFIREYIELGGVYIGASAGSNVAGEDISLALPFDENTPNLTKFGGMGLVPFSTICHYDKKDPLDIEEAIRTIDTPILAIRDNEGIILKNGIIEYIHYTL